MVYTYRITLAGIKGFFRVYAVNAKNSLYTLHKQLRSDLEFPMDQPILFKGLDENGSVVARYALIDLGAGAVDSVTIADTIKAGIKSFVYFYDIESKKSVIVTLEGKYETEEDVLMPRLLESKGPVPAEFENGYVAFEDLPDEKRKLPGESLGDGDDDDDDEDDEEDGDDEEDEEEEEEIIYDEKE